jgi:hypothetical protein
LCILPSCCLSGVTLASSTFANHLRSFLVIAHPDERAMPQVPGIGHSTKAT